MTLTMEADPATFPGDGTPSLAVDLQPDNLAGTFRLDTSELDGPDRLGWTDADAGSWLNIVCDVMRVSGLRGSTRQRGVLTRPEAGTATLVASDTAGQLDPMTNGDAIHRGTPIRLRAWGYAPVLQAVETRRNLATDPAMTSLVGWSGANVSTALGAGGVRLTKTTAAVANGYARPATALPPGMLSGRTYTISADRTLPAPLTGALDSDAGRLVAIVSAPSGNVTVRSTTAPNVAGVYRVALTVTLPAGVTALQLRFQHGGTTAGEVVAWDNLLVEEGAAVGAYFDGATADDGDQARDGAVSYDWTGAANASASVQRVQRFDWTNLERWDEVLWTGEVDQLEALYQSGSPALVTITCVDLVGVLASAALLPQGAPDGVGAGDNLLQRVTRVLALAERGTIAPNPDPTAYAVTLRPSTLTSPWADLTAAAEAELGAVWVDRYNRVVVRRRNSLTRGVEHGTLSDEHGETVVGVHCCITDALVVYSPELMVNRTLSRRRLLEGEDDALTGVYQRDDTYSQARYGLAAVERKDLELQTDAQAAAWGQALILGGGKPELRVDTVYPAPSPSDPDSAVLAWPAVCATDVGDVWAFRYRTHTGVLVTAQLRILGVAFDLTPEGWTFTWTTASAPDRERGAIDAVYVLLDVSVLGSGDVLAPFGA